MEEDYEEGKKKVKNYKQKALVLKKRGDVVAFEDETIITQKPCIESP